MAPLSAPRIWLLIGDKLGDNAQARVIADSLGLPYETRRLLPKEQYVLGKPRFRVGLEHMDMQRSDPLQAPWPDLVITTGRRHAMAALWIKAQNPATRIVLLGRPRRWIERFDLVIVPPQHIVPPLANVLQLSLPLMRIDPHRIEVAADQHRADFARLPRPLIAVLVGGPTRPMRFDARIAQQLIDCCTGLQRELAGGLCFSTSRRTPPAVVSTLERQLPEGALLHRWRENDDRNPYPALLGLADYFVVTGDSVSMMMEVVLSGKPLAIFPLPSSPIGRLWQRLKRYLWHERGGAGHGAALAGRLLYRSGVTGFGRDLGRIHERLTREGYAVIAGAPFPHPCTDPGELLAGQLRNVRARVLALLPASIRPAMPEGTAPG